LHLYILNKKLTVKEKYKERGFVLSSGEVQECQI